MFDLWEWLVLEVVVGWIGWCCCGEDVVGVGEDLVYGGGFGCLVGGGVLYDVEGVDLEVVDV